MKKTLFTLIGMLLFIGTNQVQAASLSDLDCNLYNGETGPIAFVADGEALTAKAGKVSAIITTWTNTPEVFNINVDRNGRSYGATIHTFSEVGAIYKAQGIPTQVTLLDLVPTSKNDEITVNCMLKNQ